MSLIDRDLLPVACTLTPGAGAAQLAVALPEVVISVA